MRGGRKATRAARYLQGDASVRRYAPSRCAALGAGAILMDWAAPAGRPRRSATDLPYSRIAHLAEDVRPFVAIADALRDAGLNVPAIYAQDLDTASC